MRFREAAFQPAAAQETTVDHFDDNSAIKAAQRGDRRAFEWLVRRHERRALASACGILRDREEARDVCQEAFLRAFANLARFDGKAQFYTWLHRIVINLCIDRLRRRAPAGVSIDEVEGWLPGGDCPSRRAEAHQLSQKVSQALAQLGPKHRAVLVLRELEELSYQEIATALQCSIGTVMSRLFHARRKLQALLAETEIVARAA